MRNLVKVLPVKKTNKSGVPRIKFVDLNILSRDYVILEISKKRGLSINPDIYHSKVPSQGIYHFKLCFWVRTAVIFSKMMKEKLGLPESVTRQNTERSFTWKLFIIWEFSF